MPFVVVTFVVAAAVFVVSVSTGLDVAATGSGRATA
jgi:hypothetical protein